MGRKEATVTKVDKKTAIFLASMVRMDRFILDRLSGLGALKKISRLNVTIPEADYAMYLWKEIIPAMKLLSLRVTVVERSDRISCPLYSYLEELVSASRAVSV